jgi:hypothetical protein
MFVAGVVLLVSLALDNQRWRRLRLSAFDLPALLLCMAPFLSAMANDLGPYEGASGVLSTSLVFGAPYLLGRLYLGDREGLADLAGGLVLAGLAYVPLCLWEVRMSPQLHRLTYGFAQTTMFAQNVRLGGYRPTVFMNHGLMVALFMASTTLVAYWLWRSGARRAMAGLPLGTIAAVLGVTTLLCKSTGAAALLLVGIAVLEGTRLLKRPALILLLLALPPIYCAARLGGWDAEVLVTAATGAAGGERAQSIQFRLRNERELVARALQRPGLGWGRFGRSRIRAETGRDLSITDSLWVVTLGEGGLASLLSLWLVLAMPVALLIRTAPARHWSERGVASASALAMVALLSLVDDLFNTMATPTVLLVSGALVTLHLAARAARRPLAAVRPVLFGEPGGRHAA